MVDRSKGSDPEAARSTWATPMHVIDQVEAILGESIVFDLCAEHSTAKARRYFTKEQDALSQDWTKLDDSLGYFWMNPPFGKKGVINPWPEKAYKSRKKIAALVPANTDAIWFHDWILRPGVEKIFVKGRISFEMDGVAQRGNVAPSIIAIMGYPPSKIFSFEGKSIIGSSQKYRKSVL